MTDFLMASRIEPGEPAESAEAEMVTVEHQLGQVVLELDDGVRLWFDRHELAELVADPEELVLEEHDEERAA